MRCRLFVPVAVTALLASPLLAQTSQLFGTWKGTWRVDEKYSSSGNPYGTPPYDAAEISFVIHDYDPVAQSYGQMFLPDAYSGDIQSLSATQTNITLAIRYPSIADPTAHTLLTGYFVNDNLIRGDFDDSLPPPEGLVAWRGPIEISRVAPLKFQAPFYRETPHVLTQTSHEGNDIDLAALKQDLYDPVANKDLDVPVLASLDGVPYFHVNRSDWGNFVTIDHTPAITDWDEKIYTLYAHLSDRYLLDGMAPVAGYDDVFEGRPVTAGQEIGIESNTGRHEGKPPCPGCHIHFGVYRGDPRGNPVRSNSQKLTQEAGLLYLAPSPHDPVAAYTTDVLNLLEDHQFWSDVPRPLTRNISESVMLNESRRVNFLVDSRDVSLSATLTWPGSELALAMFSPDGTLYGRLQETDGSISAEVLDPMIGLWSFEITGVDVASDGEPFMFDLHIQTLSPADFDQDGGVDADDYAVWRRDFGSTVNLTGDANDDGIVDSADYVVWRDNLEAPFSASTSRSSSVAIPEPATFIPTAIGTFLLLGAGTMRRVMIALSCASVDSACG